MATEEKKSLPSNESRPAQRRQTGFRLHYFPDIPVDGPVGDRRCSSPEDNFQRARYDNIEPVCTQSSSGVDGMNPLYTRRVLTTEEREEQACQKGFSAGKAEGLREGENVGFEQEPKK